MRWVMGRSCFGSCGSRRWWSIAATIWAAGADEGRLLASALIFPAPGSLGSFDRRFQVEFNAEISLGAHSAEIVSEVLAGNEIDPPDVGSGRWYRINGFLIRREHLPCRHAYARR